jgi:soluble lytic murein transglycosylase-like protein
MLDEGGQMRFDCVAVATGLMLGTAGCARNGVVLPMPVTQPAAPKPAPSRAPARPAKTRVVAKRPVKVDSLRLEATLLQARSHAPLAYVLTRRSGNPLIADRAAAAVVFEAQRLRLSPSFVAAVLMVENTPMDTTALSGAGAIGLMQVMPIHGGGWGCPSAELREVEANICHGTRLLHMYLRRNRTVQAALRRYNGCVGSRVTRTCLHYPARVLRTASRIRREMLKVPVDSLPPPPPPPPPPFYLRRASATLESEPARERTDGWPTLSLFAFPADTSGSLSGD